VQKYGRFLGYSGLRLPAGGGTHRPASALHAKNDMHDTLHVIEALRVQLVGHLDVLVVCPGDFEGEARARSD
jgi:hypothetical protein